MQIDILYGIEGAKNAKGITVIIDVYRAASVAAYALEQGAEYIIPVGTKEEALQLKREHPDYLLMGEEHGHFIEGFDFGNSPSEIVKRDLSHTVLVHRTSQGTQGLLHAVQADEVIFGSFPTASVIARYIQTHAPIVSLVAMDGKDSEDEVFAQYIRDVLLGKTPDKEYVKQYLRNHEVSARFLDPILSEFPKEDIEYCLDIERFDFICLVKKCGKNLSIMRHS